MLNNYSHIIVAVLLSIITTFAITTPANSASRAKQVEVSQQVAAITWYNPCGGEIRIQRGKVPGLASSFYGPFPAGSPFCVITLADDYRFGDGALCSVILHETGHLAGKLYSNERAFQRSDGLDRFHSRNQNSVMFPRLLKVDKRCKDKGFDSMTTRKVETRIKN